ncbi:MAG TPA: hypothetical protein VFA77_17790, partial [Candidatus Eisenbacteria bacterium]|nr:hypothetical protein [Candidatus Eisenbacteria bacterium]
AEQKRMEKEWAAANPEAVTRIMEERGLNQPRPSMKLPPEFLNDEQGIGAFSNPDEGVEFVLGFSHIVSGFRKKGVGLTEEELHSIRSFLISAVASPAFVRRLVAEYGVESLLETFLVRDCPPEWSLEVLLRRHKGHFYRKRYPSLSLLQPGGSSAEPQKGQAHAR